MGEYLQTERKGRVTGLLGGDDFLLRSFSGTDALSQLFRYRLELLAERRLRVPFERVLGCRATVHLWLPDGTEHHVNGLCASFTQEGRDEELTRYRAELVPDIWLLSQKTKSRIFQHLPVPDILARVLAGFAVRFDLQGRFEPRDYCVQYRESDLAFASRLMEEEGLAYFFEQADGNHTMAIADHPGAHPSLPGESSFVYEELAGGTRDDNRITRWEKTQEVRPGRVVLRDHCFELPHKHLESESVALESVRVGQETHRLRLPVSAPLELYDWPGGYAHRFDGIASGGAERPEELQKIFPDGRRTAELRMDQVMTPAVVVRGRSNVKHLSAGHVMSLRRHFNADGEYLVTSVTHDARFAGDVRAAGEPPVTYENTFTCLPRGIPFRPPRTTPRPSVRGCQTAVVVGPPGEEISCDRYGRVKVRFHWDREGDDGGDSSCWIRVSSSWAGRRWGAVHIPRVGQEVIVDFLEGDPDQPIIVGSVYNAENLPPYELPGGMTRSGIRSHSTPNGNGASFNEIRFEDRRGQEEILVHAERDLATEVERDERRSVGNDRETGVLHDDTLSVGRNLAIQVGADLALAVGGNRTTTVGGAETLEVAGGPRIVSVNGTDRLTVEGSHLASVRDEYAIRAAGVHAIASREVHLEVGGSQVQVGSDAIELRVGAQLIRIDASGIHLRGVRLEATATSGDVVITGSTVKLNG